MKLYTRAEGAGRGLELPHGVNIRRGNVASDGKTRSGIDQRAAMLNQRDWEMVKRMSIAYRTPSKGGVLHPE